jgi:hypothetical protein
MTLLFMQLSPAPYSFIPPQMGVATRCSFAALSVFRIISCTADAAPSGTP